MIIVGSISAGLINPLFSPNLLISNKLGDFFFNKKAQNTAKNMKLSPEQKTLNTKARKYEGI